MTLRCTLVVVFVLTIAAKAEQPAQLPTYQSRYYVIHTDFTGDTLREAELRMTRMFEEYRLRTAGFSGAMNQKLLFYLFKNDDDYYAAGGMRGSAGFFNPNNNTLMAMAGASIDAETWHVVQHEGFHQFAYNVIGGQLPIWANEGLAEYFGEGLFTGDGFVTGVIPPDRLIRIKKMISDRSYRPFKELMLLDHADWNKEMTMRNYDQAWSMVQFLAHAEKGRYQNAFVGFMRAVGRGRPWEQAWLASFGSADGFEKNWADYWSALPANPTADLYARATMQSLTSALARATASHQQFATFADLAQAATNDSIRINPRDWLPPSLIHHAFEEAAQMHNHGATFTLLNGTTPTLLCALGDGTKIIGQFRLENGRVAEVRAVTSAPR